MRRSALAAVSYARADVALAAVFAALIVGDCCRCYDQRPVLRRQRAQYVAVVLALKIAVQC